jgi:hypothetical protein
LNEAAGEAIPPPTLIEEEVEFPPRPLLLALMLVVPIPALPDNAYVPEYEFPPIALEIDCEPEPIVMVLVPVLVPPAKAAIGARAITEAKRSLRICVYTLFRVKFSLGTQLPSW